VTAQCEARSPAKSCGVRCVLNAGHSGAHTSAHNRDHAAATWLDPIGAHEAERRRRVELREQYPADYAALLKYEMHQAEEQREFAVLRERCEKSTAERDAFARACAALVAQLRRRGGFSTPDEQAELRFAVSLLAEHGMGAVP
jgi:hypothetical protein